MAMIIFSAWLLSGFAHVFLLLSVVTELFSSHIILPTYTLMIIFSYVQQT